MATRSKEALDLFEACQAVQRRTRILQREARIQLLERFLTATTMCAPHRTVWELEIQRCRDEIAAEGPDT